MLQLQIFTEQGIVKPVSTPLGNIVGLRSHRIKFRILIASSYDKVVELKLFYNGIRAPGTFNIAAHSLAETPILSLQGLEEIGLTTAIQWNDPNHPNRRRLEDILNIIIKK